MVVNYKIEMDDLLALQKDAVDTTNIHKRNKIIGGLLGAILLFLFAINFVKVTLGTALVFAIAMFFLCKSAYKLAIVRQTKKLIEKNHTLTIGDCISTISDKGFIREFKNTSQNISWSQVKIAKEDEERYFLYISDIQASILKKIPNNLTESELIKYHNLIRENLLNEGIVLKKTKRISSSEAVKSLHKF
ncbi:hypothetical protein ACFSTA_04405 [Ornithinibacillus salinisoli]|uniref:YcxB family protein n=1 Tax=Ornithinibacillus salinisoli TaxID=1848459 RepID=A0ABW4VVA5_9BACI